MAGCDLVSAQRHSQQSNFGIMSLHTMSATPAHRVSTGERINHEAPGRLEHELALRGIRLTRQRKVLLQVMETARRHLDADEILERAQKIDPGVTRVTVYLSLIHISLNAADEIAVAAFLAGKLPFPGIAAVIERVLERMPRAAFEKIEDVLAADGEARRLAQLEVERRKN